MGLKLNIGCAKNHLEGFVNCDICSGPDVDKQFDLQGPWPFDDESVEYIRASHIIEHLDDRIACFKEANRVLQPNGIMEIWSPFGDGPHNPDPFHKYPPLWPNSFDYLFSGNKDNTTLECDWEDPLFKPEIIEVIRIFWQRERLSKVLGSWIAKRYVKPKIGIPVEIHFLLRKVS
jgi:SAM-dependent methyltransferase